VQSYLDHIDIGLTCDHKAVPDADHLGDLMVDSFEELSSAAAKAAKAS
jgi:hypothetical protein